MKLFLDDVRIAPTDWVQIRWPEDAIAVLKSGNVKEISLDHDLGDDSRGTGYDVLKWIEEAVVTSDFKPPKIHIHTSNPAARKRMELAKEAIKNIVERKQ